VRRRPRAAPRPCSGWPARHGRQSLEGCTRAFDGKPSATNGKPRWSAAPRELARQPTWNILLVSVCNQRRINGTALRTPAPAGPAPAEKDVTCQFQSASRLRDPSTVSNRPPPVSPSHHRLRRYFFSEASSNLFKFSPPRTSPSPSSQTKQGPSSTSPISSRTLEDRFSPFACGCPATAPALIAIRACCRRTPCRRS